VIVLLQSELGAFDQSNCRTSEAIDSLERQVQNYKFELEEARNVIEKQHN
jgi:hypothetical protein